MKDLLDTDTSEQVEYLPTGGILLEFYIMVFGSDHTTLCKPNLDMP